IQIISYASFANCRKLKELFIPSNVVHLGREAFFNWTAEQVIRMPIRFKKPFKFMQKWRKKCKANIIYY
ncbi:MAG: leucine-rich repeat domain-containing protein, partial [Clostridia bacterium]|nr:leucine-rich repeat domain-containing protein [Clostridia bacterium]